MPPPTPEQRFEVPPEYAEVYERAYRRAYEEGQGQLSSSEPVDPVRRVRGRRGSRLSRSSHRAVGQPRAAQWTQQWPGQHSDRDEQDDRAEDGRAGDGRAGDDRVAEPVPTPLDEPDQHDRPEDAAPASHAGGHRAPVQPEREEAGPASPGEPTARTTEREPVPVVVVNPEELGLAPRAGHRGKRRRRASSILSMLGLVLLALLLLAGTFVVGRLSVGRVDVPGVPAGAPPAVRASVSAAPVRPTNAVVTGLAGLQAAMEPPGPYRGPVARLSGARADATCVAPADRDGRGRRVSYAPGNVLDGQTNTAWLCKGSGVGQRLTITLPTTTDVVRVGLVPGYAKLDRYPQNNRITRVAWVFDDGTRVVQTMSGSKSDRSLRTLRIDPVTTRTVVLEIRGLVRGAKNNTATSAVRLDTYAGTD